MYVLSAHMSAISRAISASTALLVSVSTASNRSYRPLAIDLIGAR